MKIINPEVNVWGECPLNLEQAYSWIERAGRTCYRSEDNIIEGSDKKFVNNIIARGHLSVMEHSNFVITTKSDSVMFDAFKYIREKFPSPFLRTVLHNEKFYVGGNYRAWMEMWGLKDPAHIREVLRLEDSIEIVENPDEIPNDLKMITVEYLTDRAVTHELVRHRLAGYSQESQRYVSYKENLEVTMPIRFLNRDDDELNKCLYKMWVQSVEYAERAYKYLLKKEPDSKRKAERARIVLPNQTATKIVMSANIMEWKHVFKLRCSVRAYSEIRHIMQITRSQFQENGWI